MTGVGHADPDPVPRVSVILPTRNRVSLLPRAVQSVTAQTFAAWELLIVDDASSDGTPALVAQLSADDARVKPIRLPARAGAAAARNHALRTACGEFIAFLDDDDEWAADKLERQILAFHNSPEGTGLVHGPFIEIDSHGGEHPAGDFIARDGAARRVLLDGNVLGHSTVLVRRSVVEAAGGFDERLPRLQDWDLWLRISSLTRFCHAPGVLARIHRTPVSISTESTALRTACEVMVEKYSTDERMSGSDRARLWQTLARLLVDHGQAAAGRSLILRSLRSMPWPPARVLMALVILAGRGPYRLVTRVHGQLRRALHRRPHHLPSAGSVAGGGQT